MRPHTNRALTLASAAHLLQQGHITKPKHDEIVAKVRAVAPIRRQKPPRMPAMGFGSLAQPQQAQAPIPGISGPAATPDGTSSGY